jgi:hypothetical protein
MRATSATRTTWVGPDLWGKSQVPMSVAAARRQGASALRDLQEHAAEEREAADSHLRTID